jgi:hypothetical protein
MKTNSLPAAENQPPKLRWYQWRLRSLFVLTFLVAVAMSYLVVLRQEGRKQKAAVDKISTCGGKAKVVPTWLGRFLHDDSVVKVTSVFFVGTQYADADAGMKHLKGLDQLEELCIDNANLTDAAMEHLQWVPQLKSLRTCFEIA